MPTVYFFCKRSAEIIDWEKACQTLSFEECESERKFARVEQGPRDYVAGQGRNEDQSIFCWKCSSSGKITRTAHPASMLTQTSLALARRWRSGYPKLSAARRKRGCECGWHMTLEQRARTKAIASLPSVHRRIAPLIRRNLPEVSSQIALD